MPIAIRANKREYSKYEPELAMVDLTVTGIPPAIEYQFALVREDGFGDVIMMRETPTADPYQFGMDLLSETMFDDELGATRDNVNYVTQGMYHAEVRDDSGLLARSASFPISVIPVETFKRHSLFGIPLYAEEVMQVVAQPRRLTGARVVYVDPAMLKGPGMLEFVPLGGTLAWRGGPIETIVPDEVQLVRLLTPEGDAYLEVEIDPFLLPTVDTAESLLIDNWRLNDADVRHYLWHAYEWIQQQLQLRLETTITTTDPATFVGHYDETAVPVMFERGQYRSINIGGPRTKPLQKVISLFGAYGGAIVLSVPSEWILFDYRGASIDLLPYGGSVATSQIAPTPHMFAPSMSGHIQNFWHFSVIAGLRTLESDRHSIREAIENRAALELLSDLSLAATAGRTNRSANREGVSESWSYGGQGAYGEKIGSLNEWLKTYIPKLRQYHTGLSLVVL